MLGWGDGHCRDCAGAAHDDGTGARARCYACMRSTAAERMKRRGGPHDWAESARQHLLCQSNHKTQVIWKGLDDLLCYSLTFLLLRASRGCWRCLLPLRRGRTCGPSGR
jgi:hypothetical protein